MLILLLSLFKMGIFSNIKRFRIIDSKPVSDKFGFDRGTPIDRYYIEKFLASNKADIKGESLEIAEDTYIRKYGESSVKPNVLHYDNSNPKATIIGDLCDTSSIPENRFDCFICTQTYNFIYDFQKAIEGSYQLLKPGGVLLATVASMSPISKYDADRWGDFWRFTPQSSRRMMQTCFKEEHISIFPYGNSAAAALFMKGYAQEDLKGEVNLDANDELFPLIIGIRAKK